MTPNIARFSDTLELGETVTHCIEVTYSGTSDPSPVKFYSGGFTDTSNLADHLNVTIDEGNGGDFIDLRRLHRGRCRR